jgi:hypothetical protein
MQTALVNLGSNNTLNITGNSTNFRQATFFGISGFTSSGTPQPNQKPVYLGPNSSGQMPYIIPTGGSVEIYLENPVRDNLSNYYIMGQQLDGCFVVYV